MKQKANIHPASTHLKMPFYCAAKADILFDILRYTSQYLYERKGKGWKSQGTYKSKNAN